MEDWYKKNYDPSKECFKIGSLGTQDFFENELDEKGHPRCMTDYQIEDVLNYLKTTQKNVGILIFTSMGLTKEKVKKTSYKPIPGIDKVDKLYTVSQLISHIQWFWCLGYMCAVHC